MFTNLVMRWLIKRLSEASTWSGLFVALLAGVGLPAETGHDIAMQLAIVAAGIFQAIKKDKGNSRT